RAGGGLDAGDVEDAARILRGHAELAVDDAGQLSLAELREIELRHADARDVDRAAIQPLPRQDVGEVVRSIDTEREPPRAGIRDRRRIGRDMPALDLEVRIDVDGRLLRNLQLLRDDVATAGPPTAAAMDIDVRRDHALEIRLQRRERDLL